MHRCNTCCGVDTSWPQLEIPRMTGMSGTREFSGDGDSEPLLKHGIGHSSTYGLVNCSSSLSLSGESETKLESKRSWIGDVFHIREPVVRCCLIACLASLITGMALGFSSATFLELDDADSVGTMLTATQRSLFAAFFPLGAVFGGLFAWPVTDLLGRKPALMIGGVPAITGWLVFTYAPFVNSYTGPTSGFFALLLLGRLFTGFSAGWSIYCVSVYIAEVAPADYSGRFGNCNQLFSTIGALISYGLGAIWTSTVKVHYYNLSLVGAGVVALFELLMLSTYETPRWLYKKAVKQTGILKWHTEEEAFRIMNLLREPKDNVPEEILGIKKALQKNLTLVEQLIELKRRSVYIPFVLVLLLMFFQQFSGINVAIFFTGDIFAAAGLANISPRLLAFVAVGVVQVVATLVSVILVDWCGRKQLLVVSSVGMCISSALIGTNYVILDRLCENCYGTNCTSPEGKIQHHEDHPFCDNVNIGVLAIVGVIIFILAFSLGWGPIPWTSMSELVPGRVRSLYASIASMVNWSFAIIITAVFQPYSGKFFTWVIFAVILFVSIFIVIIFLPEVKGHSLEQIEDHFENGKIIAIACKCSFCKKQPSKEKEVTN